MFNFPKNTITIYSITQTNSKGSVTEDEVLKYAIDAILQPIKQQEKVKRNYRETDTAYKVFIDDVSLSIASTDKVKIGTDTYRINTSIDNHQDKFLAFEIIKE